MANKYCQNLIRSHDFDYWLMGLVLPARARSGFYAIRAFNVETANVIDSVRGEVLPGQIRLRWWKDVVHKIYTSANVPTEYPVALSLASAVEAHGLSRRWLDRVLEARENDLASASQQLESMTDLERYCDGTATSMLLLSLECLRPPPTAAGKHPPWPSGAVEDLAARHAGQAIGLCTLLRGTAFHAARGRLYLPHDLMKRHGARAQTIMQGPALPVDPVSKKADDSDLGSVDEYLNAAEWEQAIEERRKRRRQPPIAEAQREACRSAVRAVAELASHHLDAAAALCDGNSPSGVDDKRLRTLLERRSVRVPRTTMGAFLPAIRARRYLTALGKCGYDLHDPTLWPTPDNERAGRSRVAFQLRMLGSAWGFISPFEK